MTLPLWSLIPLGILAVVGIYGLYVLVQFYRAWRDGGL